MHGEAAILMDARTGQVLYQHNGQVKNYPASTTKLLTALVALEHGNLDQVIEVSARAAEQPWDSSSCHLAAGERQSLRHLLHGLLIVSGNDCADAIAEGLTGGKPELFITWMNETAAKLGAKQSHFANPTGLHEREHYSTAYDLALIARAAMANPTLQAMANTRQFSWPGKSERNGIYYHGNALLFTYDGAIGGKTGYTEEAGFTLVTAAERNGMRLISVVLGEPSRSVQNADAAALLDYGFNGFEQVRAVSKDDRIGTVAVARGREEQVTAIAGADFPVTVRKARQHELVLLPRLKPSVRAPVRAGQEVGLLEVRDGDRLVGTVPLLAAASVAEEPLFAGIPGLGDLALPAWLWLALKWAAVGLGGLLLLRLVVRTVRRAFRRRRPGPYRERPGAHRPNAYEIRSYRPRQRPGSR